MKNLTLGVERMEYFNWQGDMKPEARSGSLHREVLKYSTFSPGWHHQSPSRTITCGET